ncbi:MAG TPA: hypothetical protein VFN11_11185 [Ktedonobacterales bacterium]|nr:hypothetical protein [Ktedonobacterales bacterium]
MHIPRTTYQLVATPRPSPASARPHRGYTGHAHFWERALSRRQIMRTAAFGSAVVVGSGLLAPGLAFAKKGSSAPKPIPETLFPGAPFHVLSPDSEEPSTIYDFNGFIGATEIQGTGTGDGTSGLLFDVDMRFMKGVYVGVDGLVHQGAFSFV